MNKKSKTGKLGEDLACRYLKQNRYFVIERNFRRPWGELDIVAKHRDGTLVFVEVKALQHYGHYDNHDDDYDNQGELRPEDNLTRSKLEKLKRTASLYANSKPEFMNNKKGWRIDLVAIDFFEDPEEINLTDYVKQSKTYSLRHYENIA